MLLMYYYVNENYYLLFMYNMDISIFGFKINLEILILIGVIYLILVGHSLCGCSNYSLMEGLEMIGNIQTDLSNNQIRKIRTDLSNNELRNDVSGNLLTQVGDGKVTPAGAAIVHAKNGNATKNNKKLGKEGFVGANTNAGQSSPYDLASNKPVNTSSWFGPDLVVQPGQPLSQGVNNILNRPEQPIPLPEGEMLLFANTKFAPEYCPNTYSTSSGCAQMSVGQYNYLKNRGGNNVPYSEF